MRNKNYSVDKANKVLDGQEDRAAKKQEQELKDDEEQFNDGFNRAHDFDYEETMKAFNKVGHLTA